MKIDKGNRNNFSKFYIGQDVICINPTNNSNNSFRINEHTLYTIKGIKKCVCGCVKLDIGYKSNTMNCCIKCYNVLSTNTWWLSAHRFKPLDEAVQLSELFNEIKQPITYGK